LTDLPASSLRSLRDLRQLTPARVALGRSGASLPTEALLDFTLAHARARDAVHATFDTDALDAELRALGLTTVKLSSRAQGRVQYLARPDLGRQLDDATRDQLTGTQAPCDVAIMIGDGLSPVAVRAHAVAVIRLLLPRLAAAGLAVGPAAIATGARVALGDEIGALLGARIIVLLIGERPGLSAPHSLGAYLTFAPRPGLTDADRNCVSNIHAAGITPEEAAFKIAWLVDEALARRLSGVALKDESGIGGSPSGLAELTGSV
jgi:ethanolamine ammonia-lyase small subunit